MGTSNWQNINYSIELIRHIAPQSVLDVGCGFGRWGFLCREFLDVWEGRTYSESWKVRIEGIEAFPPNITPMHHYIYNNIYIGDAAQVIEQLSAYDLIIFGDVLEHFVKDEGEQLLQKAIAHTNKAVLIHVPLGIGWEQGPRDDNIYETHRSVWEARDLRRFGATIRGFRDFLGRRFAVAIIVKEGIRFPSTSGLWLMKWNLALKYDLYRILQKWRKNRAAMND
jgi:SAM-dependent methyltransferase